MFGRDRNGNRLGGGLYFRASPCTALPPVINFGGQRIHRRACSRESANGQAAVFFPAADCPYVAVEVGCDFFPAFQPPLSGGSVSRHAWPF